MEWTEEDQVDENSESENEATAESDSNSSNDNDDDNDDVEGDGDGKQTHNERVGIFSLTSILIFHSANSNNFIYFLGFNPI